jgi:hypothetical protein
LLNGWLVDTYPGAVGHRYYFLFFAGLSILGAVCATALGRLAHRTRQNADRAPKTLRVEPSAS